MIRRTLTINKLWNGKTLITIYWAYLPSPGDICLGHLLFNSIKTFNKLAGEDLI